VKTWIVKRKLRMETTYLVEADSKKEAQLMVNMLRDLSAYAVGTETIGGGNPIVVREDKPRKKR